MDKRELQELLSKYLKGSCSPEESILIERWLDKISDPRLDLSDLEKADSKERILTNIQRARSKELKVVPFSRRSLPWVAAAVVSIFILIGLGRLWIDKSADQNFTDQTLAAEYFVIRENKSTDIEEIHLPDQSKVLLEPNSQIKFAKKFDGQNREVWLTGEAFFEVTKNTSKPFFVYGSHIVTRVLGTSFKVKAPANTQTIEVEVKTGKVSVYENIPESPSPDKPSANPEANGVILTPNQKVVYYVKENHWVTGLVENPRVVRLDDSATTLIFDDTPMPEVLKSLENDYGIEFVIDNEKINNCTFTGDVSHMVLYNALDFITRSIAASYELRGTKILVSGAGCD